MVTILALVSAILYGTADFLGGAGSRRAPVLALLVVSTPVGTVLMIVAALFAGGAPPPMPRWPGAPRAASPEASA